MIAKIRDTFEYIKERVDLSDHLDTIKIVAEKISSSVPKESIEEMCDIICSRENCSSIKKEILDSIKNKWDELPWDTKLEFSSILSVMAYVKDNNFTGFVLSSFMIDSKIRHPEIEYKVN
jgi:hypothetical protein